jgi:hypothetical protein
MKKMKWKRVIVPFDFNSDYVTKDGDSTFQILRNRKTSRVQLFIWREHREEVSEKHNYLPSVKFAKAFAETRREKLEKVSWRGNARLVDNENIW